MHDVVLTGLDGTNPLGFLAALGVMEAFDEAVGARVSWRHVGAWRPVIRSPDRSIESLVQRLDIDRQGCLVDPALALTYDGKSDLKPRPERFRAFLVDLRERASPANRRSVDWAAAFATDIAVDNNGNTKPTALHFTAGQQQFLQMVNELARRVTAEDLREAVEGPWRYERPLPVMGWDSTVSRDYALRATDPSSDKKRGIPGADWLAIRGLAALPTVPCQNRILTTCCSGGWKDGRFRWPLWTVPLAKQTIRSVLSSDAEGMSRREREARGIGAVFTSGIRRSDQGGYGSFEPAMVI